MHTLAIINQKGGCGKTTSAINLAGIFARQGFRTLLVDMDPQSHCASGLAIPEGRIDLDIGDAMLHDSKVPPPDELEVEPFAYERLLWRVSRNFDLAPSRVRMAGLESSRGGLAHRLDKHRRLKIILEPIRRNYDICFIDCSPSIGLLTFNALVAANAVLVPVETSYFSLQGASRQVQTIKTLSQKLDAPCPWWLLPTLHEPDSVLASDLLEELGRRFGEAVIPTPVRRDIALKESASFGLPVTEYAPESNGSRDYAGVASWLAERLRLVRASRPRLPEPVKLDPGEAFESEDGVVSVLTSQATSAGLARRVSGATREQTATAPKLSPTSTPAPEPKPEREPESITSAPSQYGVHPTSQGIRFVQPLDLGTSIAIAGDFNDWSPTANPMQPDESRGAYVALLDLPPGCRRYRLVVDGRWTRDAHNPASEINAFGEANSIIMVEPKPDAERQTTQHREHA